MTEAPAGPHRGRTWVRDSYRPRGRHRRHDLSAQVDRRGDRSLTVGSGWQDSKVLGERGQLFFPMTGNPGYNDSPRLEK